MEQRDTQALQQRILADTAALAEQWRISGRWLDALTLVKGRLPLATEGGAAALAQHWLLVGRILTDQGLFGGLDTAAELDAALAHALRYAEQTSDGALQGAAWDARGMALHAAFLDSDRAHEPPDELAAFERGLTLRQQSDDERAIAESLFHVGLVYGVVRQQHEQALPYFEDSYRRATLADDPITASYAIRHIAFARHAAGDDVAGQAALEESLRLREAAQWTPGVAMALVALSYPIAEAGNTSEAIDLLRRAQRIFTSLDAPARVAEVERQIADVVRGT